MEAFARSRQYDLFDLTNIAHDINGALTDRERTELVLSGLRLLLRKVAGISLFTMSITNRDNRYSDLVEIAIAR